MKNVLFVLGLVGLFAGCQGPKAAEPALDLTLNRGAQLLAAGSPKSAIPFLTQTIASSPMDPEPVALLSLAYALDLQPEQALAQAQKVQRKPGEAPGWEAVAVGIAQTCRHRHDDAMASYQQVIMTAAPGSPMLPAARQWLAMSQIVKGDRDGALVTLEELSKSPAMRPTALLWTALVRARGGETAKAAASLTQCAAEVAATFPRPAADAAADDQALYDAAIVAIGEGKFDEARALIAELRKRDGDTGDAAVWLALVDAAEGRWQAARNSLSDTCENGPLAARALANQLSAVVRAMEDRPESMVHHTLAGQRITGRTIAANHVMESPKPETVWFSDWVK